MTVGGTADTRASGRKAPVPRPGASRGSRAALAGVLLLALACTTRTAPVPDVGVVVFPLPPDTARIQFLTRFSSASDVEGKRGSVWRRVVGADEPEDEAIRKPYGLAAHRNRIYVCDTMLPGVVILDLTERRFRRFQPRGEAQLRKPINCTVDRASGWLYVTDTDRGQVVVYDTTLRYVGAFGEGEGAKPSDVVVEGDRIWVSDLAAGRVLVYDRATRRLLFAFPEAGADTSAVLRQPTNLAVADDFVYVSEFTDFRVKVYTTEGRFVRAVGMLGTGGGQFARPKGVAVDRDGRLYVVDAAFENVQMFDRDGRLLMHFGGPYAGPGDMYLPAKVALQYDNLDYFRRFVDPRFALEYVILVSNQYGPDKIGVYGFIHQRGGAGARP